MIFIRIKGHFDDKIFLTKFKDISQNSRTFHGFQGFQGQLRSLVQILGEDYLHMGKIKSSKSS